MKIGLDYWHVCSDYPEFFTSLTRNMTLGTGWNPDLMAFSTDVNEVHVISAIGKNRKGTIAKEIYSLGIRPNGVHEVVFNHPAQSPMLKTAKCLELGITVFFDDRQDVCDAMGAAGILAFRVPRLKKQTDVEAEIK